MPFSNSFLGNTLNGRRVSTSGGASQPRGWTSNSGGSTRNTTGQSGMTALGGGNFSTGNGSGVYISPNNRPATQAEISAERTHDYLYNTPIWTPPPQDAWNDAPSGGASAPTNTNTNTGGNTFDPNNPPPWYTPGGVMLPGVVPGDQTPSIPNPFDTAPTAPAAPAAPPPISPPVDLGPPPIEPPVDLGPPPEVQPPPLGGGGTSADVNPIDWSTFDFGGGRGGDVSFTPYTDFSYELPPLSDPNADAGGAGGWSNNGWGGGGTAGGGRHGRTQDDDTSFFGGVVNGVNDFFDDVASTAGDFFGSFDNGPVANPSPVQNGNPDRNLPYGDDPNHPMNYPLGGLGAGQGFTIPENIYDPITLNGQNAPFTYNDMDLLFEEVFQKEPDPEGLEWWANTAIQNGMTLDDIKAAVRAEGAALQAANPPADTPPADAPPADAPPPDAPAGPPAFDGSFLDFKTQLDALYEEVLGRGVQTPGSNFYWNDGRPMSFDEIRQDLLLSDERGDLDSDWEGTNTATEQAVSAILEEIAGLDPSDTQDAGRIQGLIDDLLGDIGGYNNPVYGGMPGDFTTQLSDARTSLDQLLGAAETAQGDISGYEQGIITSARDIRDRLDALDEWDQEGAQALMREFDQLIEDASLYQSDYEFDFSDELGAISPVRQQINSFLQNWNTLDSNRRGNLSSLQGQIMSGSHYNLNQIDAWGRSLEELARGDDVSEYSGMLDTLRGRFSSGVGDLRTYMDEVAGGLSDIPLHDLGSFQRLGNQFNDLSVDINRYQGGEAFGLRDDLRSYMRNLTGRLNERGQYVTGIENSAESALRTAQAGAYKRLEDLEALRAQYNEIGSDVDLYDVMAAEDEMMELLNFIQSEEARIKEDLRTSEQYANQGGTVNGGGMFADLGFAGGGYLSDDQIIALLSARDAEQNGPGRSRSASPFSSSLGVIRV